MNFNFKSFRKLFRLFCRLIGNWDVHQFLSVPPCLLSINRNKLDEGHGEPRRESGRETGNPRSTNCSLTCQLILDVYNSPRIRSNERTTRSVFPSLPCSWSVYLFRFNYVSLRHGLLLAKPRLNDGQ